jgi:DNA-binding Xre family transcriptional regulator
MYRDKFETIMRIKHITKTQLANALGIQKQNVNSLLSTTDIRKINAIC